MNYLAHGLRFVDRPYFLAGTAVPDWLSVADRRVRARAEQVAPRADADGDPASQVAAGILRHLEDDDWFHRTAAFYETSGTLGRGFRELLGPCDGFLPGFLGHIVLEMLLDAVLMTRHPQGLAAYYRALDEVDPQVVQEAVNRVVRVPTTRLAVFVGLFRHERFLEDYPFPERLLRRLNQVLRRVKLDPLPAAAERVLAEGRTVVECEFDRLLPPDRFVPSPFAPPVPPASP
jgi:hypothetical protein